jgi:hypothetical protein
MKIKADFGEFGPPDCGSGSRVRAAQTWAAFVHAKIKPGSLETLGRPTITPQDVARRFKAFLSASDQVPPPEIGTRNAHSEDQNK